MEMKIFPKSRVANFMAGTTIAFTLYAFAFQTLDANMLQGLTAISGFAAKHLWDSANNEGQS